MGVRAFKQPKEEAPIKMDRIDTSAISQGIKDAQDLLNQPSQAEIALQGANSQLQAQLGSGTAAPAQKGVTAQSNPASVDASAALTSGDFTDAQKKALKIIMKYESGGATFNAINQMGTDGGKGGVRLCGHIGDHAAHKGKTLTGMTVDMMDTKWS